MIRHRTLASSALAAALLTASLSALAPAQATPDRAPSDADSAALAELADGLEAVATPLTVEEHAAGRHRAAPATPAARAAGVSRVFPVPTSGADLGRITTAPNGDMWFVEEKANKVGRITTSGTISEFNLPATTTGDGSVKDLDVDAAGNVWVVWDTGWRVTRFHPSDPGGAYSWEFTYPYGEEVRVGPNGTWVTLDYDENGIAKVVGNTMTWAANAPECDGALGRGRDGFMWCQQFDRLIRVNADGAGGVTKPLPSNATYPHSVATGPNHAIWFGRDSGGTIFTSPSSGNVGWVTTSGAVRTINTGSRTAPRSLVAGADGNVWFTSVGSVEGIGHVNPSGRGAIVKVGNYRPNSVTYGKDGNLWATDSANNSILRISRSTLWRTNVAVGNGSQLKAWPQPKLAVKSKRINADKRRTTAPLTLTCARGKGPCTGSVVVKAGAKKVGQLSYSLSAGSSKKVKLKLNKTARKLLAGKSKVKVKVVAKPRGAKARTTRAVLTR